MQRQSITASLVLLSGEVTFLIHSKVTHVSRAIEAYNVQEYLIWNLLRDLKCWKQYYRPNTRDSRVTVWEIRIFALLFNTTTVNSLNSTDYWRGISSFASRHHPWECCMDRYWTIVVLTQTVYFLVYFFLLFLSFCLTAVFCSFCQCLLFLWMNF